MEEFMQKPKTPARKANSVFFGWRPELPDHRDLPYGAMRMSLEAPAVLPAHVDMRPSCPTVYDQGQLGSCTANAIAGAFEFDRLKQGAPDLMPSRLFIYWNERALEGTTTSDAGAYLRDGIKSIATSGVCRETDWPYDTTMFADKPSPDCFTSAVKYEAVSYFRLNNGNMTELKSCLSAGYPFVFGFSIYNSFFDGDGDGMVPMPNNETQIGGHAVLCVGYDDTMQRSIIRNSWGPNKGDNGYYYMPYQYLTNTSLSDDFWTVRTVTTDAFHRGPQ
jgi:C1A family cysteine protease